LEDAKVVAHSNIVSASKWLEHNAMREDMRLVTTNTAVNNTRLLAEADALSEGSWLHSALAPVLDAADRLQRSQNLVQDL
jgi:hypothetical protein